MSSPATPPLSGVKVLDFSQNLPGPYATFLLACWGAEVVKIEPPKGDPARFMRPFFDMVNRGKQSVVLDLRDPASRPALEALVRWADVLVEGFRPGVMERLGCGYEAARALSPRLVYCSISAFGQQGPLRDHPGHDLNLQALAGVAHLERDAAGIPRGSLLPVADLSSSLLAVSAISAALARRDRTGEGSYLDVAMADGALSWASVWGGGVDLASQARRQLGESRLGGPKLARAALAPFLAFLDRAKLYALPHYGVFATRGGPALALGIVDEDHFWKALCEELGLGARLGGLRLPQRIAAGLLLRPLVAAALRRRTTEEWLPRFEAKGVPASPCLTVAEAAESAQVRARGLVDARGWIGSPLPGAVLPTGGAPERGQHTREVLSSLGLDAS